MVTFQNGMTMNQSSWNKVKGNPQATWMSSSATSERESFDEGFAPLKQSRKSSYEYIRDLEHEEFSEFLDNHDILQQFERYLPQSLEEEYPNIEEMDMGSSRPSL